MTTITHDHEDKHSQKELTSPDFNLLLNTINNTLGQIDRLSDENWTSEDSARLITLNLISHDHIHISTS